MKKKILVFTLAMLVFVGVGAGPLRAEPGLDPDLDPKFGGPARAECNGGSCLVESTGEVKSCPSIGGPTCTTNDCHCRCRHVNGQWEAVNLCGNLPHPIQIDDQVFEE